MRSSSDIPGHERGEGAEPVGVTASGPSSAWGETWAVERWPVGWSVRHRAVTGSTNDDLVAAASTGSVGVRTAFVADHQTAGRGRLDRRWEAPAGSNLLVSLLTDVAGPPSLVVQRVGVALIEAIERLVGGDVPDLGLKWPNDVVVANRKLAGVLAQAHLRAGRAPIVVVGCGVNVGWAPEGAVSIDDITASPSAPSAVLARLLAAFDDIAEESDVVLRRRYRARLLTLGRDVRIELPGGRHVEGRATDVDADGRLEVTAAGRSSWYHVGDVVHLRADHSGDEPGDETGDHTGGGDTPRDVCDDG